MAASRWRGSDQKRGERLPKIAARCPYCGGGIPFDTDDLTQVCMCGIDWATMAPFPKADLTGAEWQHVRSLLLLRSGGRCELTGVALEANRWSVHHRRARGMGGTERPDVHSLANLLVVTGDGTTGVHGWIETHREQAYELGWLIRRESIADPETVAFVLYSGRRALLDPTQPFYLPAPGPAYTTLDLPFPAAA